MHRAGREGFVLIGLALWKGLEEYREKIESIE
jgi:hypothetical protein